MNLYGPKQLADSMRTVRKNTFDGRMAAIRPRLERLKTSTLNEPAAAR